jgi:hypothetical protein
VTETEADESAPLPVPQVKVRRKSRSQTQRRLSRRLLRLGLATGIIVLAAGGRAAWLARRADQIRTHLKATTVLLPAVQQELLAGDVERGKAVPDKLQEHARAAREAGADPPWKAVSAISLVGANFSAVNAATLSADDVIHGAVAPSSLNLVRLRGSIWDRKPGKSIRPLCMKPPPHRQQPQGLSSSPMTGWRPSTTLICCQKSPHLWTKVRRRLMTHAARSMPPPRRPKCCRPCWEWKVPATISSSYKTVLRCGPPAASPVRSPSLMLKTEI